MSLQEVNDLIQGGRGAPAFKFANIGDTVRGEVVDASKTQAIDYTTQQPAVWDDGKPKVQVVITLATDLREGPDDDGHRRLFAVVGQGDLLHAIRRALDGRALELGGTLAVRYDHDEQVVAKSGARLNPKKCFVAAYNPPTRTAADDLLGGAPTQQQAPLQAGTPSPSADDLI